MNKQYRIVWQEATQQWVVVSELTKSHGPSTSVLGGNLRSVVRAFVLRPIAWGFILLGWSQAWAASPVPNQLPTGGQVVAGQAAISQSAAVMNVDQTSQRAAIDWQSFNVGSAAQVNFNQPNSSSVTLNRVLDNNPSQIFGRITAPGQVFLVNPAGAYFAPSASVEVGGLMATTHSLSNEDFMAGRNTLVRNGATGRIVNEGQLKASLGGYIALLAPEVRNNGVVVAQMGTVALAAGEAYTLQFDGKGLLSNVVVTPATMKALVENGNAVEAPGGLIILSAQAASRLQGGIVNNTGSLQASGLVKEGGRILLRASDQINHSGSMQADAAPGSAGQGGHITLIADLNNPESVTRVSGSISAKGGVLGGDGGFIETSGSRLSIEAAASVSAAAPKGKGGEWLLDPGDITIQSSGLTTVPSTGGAVAPTTAASTVDVDALNTALSNGSVVTINTNAGSGGNGDITVNNAIAKTNGGNTGSLTLTADRDIVLNASISATSTGNTLPLTLSAKGNIRGSGAIGTNGGLLTLDAQSGTGTLSGVISGTGGLTKTGDGAVVLSASNTYTGPTQVTKGTLTAGNISAFGSNSAVTMADDATAALSLGGYRVAIGSLAGGGSAGGNVVLGASGFLTAGSNNSTTTYAGVISGGAPLALTDSSASTTNLRTATAIGSNAISGIDKVGAGNWTLSGLNTYQGLTRVTGGTLTAGVGSNGALTASALGNASNVVVWNSAVLNLNNFSTEIGLLRMETGTSSLTLGTATLTVNTFATNDEGDTRSTRFNGKISGTGGNLVVKGSGTLFFISVGNGASAYTGTTTIEKNAKVQIGSSSANANEAFKGSGEFINNGLITYIETGYSRVFANKISGEGKVAINFSGNITATLSGANTYTGGTTVSGATLKAGSSSAFGANAPMTVSAGATLDLGGNSNSIGSLDGGGIITNTGASATLTVTSSTNTTFSGVIKDGSASNLLSLTKAGVGTLTLSGTNTYTGITTLAAGTLSVATINAGGAAGNLGQASADAGNLVLNGGTLQYTATGATASTNRAFTLMPGTTSTIEVTSAASVLTMSGASASTTGSLTKSGSGTLTLSGVNSFSGTTNITGGSLILANPLALQYSTLNLTNSGFSFGGLTEATLGGLSGSSALSLTNSATPSAGVVLRVGNNDSNTHYAGILSGVAGSLMKVGAGTFMLSGDNTYGGGTTISGGTLQVGSGGSTGALGSGWVTNNASLIFNRTANTTIANVVSGSGSVLATITGNLTLSAGASVSSTANDIVLSVSGNFINNAGNTALSATGNGKRWVVYSADPSLNTFNGLISGSKALWGSTYLSLPPISVGTGNRYVFSASGGTVTASTTVASKTYGDPAISLTGQISYSLTGPAFGSGNSYGVYASNEFNDSMSTTPSIASSGNTLAAGVGTYAYTFATLGVASGGFSYTSLNNGSFTVAPKTVTYVGSTTNVTYNASPQSANNTYQLTGVISSDLSNVSLSASTAARGTNAGTYLDTVSNLSGTASGNYQLASSGNTLGSLVIAAKPLTYIGSTTNVVYNASPRSANNTYQLTGVIASDVGNVSLSASTAASGTNAGTYLDTVTNLSGIASGNYQLASSGNTLGSLVIAAKPLNYIGNTTNVTYNASPQSASNSYQLTGVIASDVGNVSLSASTAASGTNAGTYLDTVTNLSGTASGNYQLASSGNTLGSLVIAAKPLNYIGSTTNVTYNASPQSANNTYQLTGVIASDVGNVSLIASTAASGTNAGTYLDTVTNLSGTASGNYQLASSGNTLGSLVIATKSLTYIGSTTNVTYNASPQSANNTYQLTGLIASDVGNVILSASTSASGTNAGTYLDAVTSLSGTASGNYQLASGGNTLGSLVIAAKPLNYIGNTTNVTYNASPQSASNSYQLTGVIASDVGNVSLIASTAASGTNAGTYLDTVTNLSGTASGNYQLASSGNTLGTLVIAAKPLTYIGSTTNMTYNASPQSANNTYQLMGVIASDLGNVNLSAAVAGSGTNAGTYFDTVTNLSGTASGNYQLASSGNTLGSLVIAAKPLNYIGSTTNVTYNASPQSASNSYQLTGVIASDVGNVSLIASTAASGTNAGTYFDTVTNLGGTASGNYQLASSGNTLGTLVIAAKPLTYIGSATNVTYNASPQSANNTYQLMGVIASDLGNVNLSAAVAGSGTNAGTYFDTVTNLSGIASGNYQLASSGNTLGSLVIAAKPLNYIGSTTNVTYNASPQSANNTYQLTGVIASDVGNVSLIASTAASGTNAGTYLDAVTSLSGTSSGNYQLASSGNTLGSLVIAAKPLNYIGNTTNVTYNASPQSANNTYQLTGVISSDVGNVILSASTSASGTNAGTYLDTVTNLSGAASGNYQLASSGNTLGSLVIAAKPLTYIGSTTNVTYNARPQSANNTYQLTGVIASDIGNVSLSASTSASGTNAGTFQDTVSSLSGTASGNYQLASSGNTLGSLVIAAKPLNYIGSTTNVTYNASPQSANNTYQLTGVIASDLGNVHLTASTSARGTNAGTYFDTVTNLSGAASGNYQLASSGNTLGGLVIAAKPLNYIGSTTNVTYNASPQSANNTYQLTGIIASDVGNVILSASTSASGTNAGTYLDTVTNLSGTASGNYQLASSGNTLGSLVIAAKPLNYIGNTTNVTYNASPQSANNTYQLTGVIASDIGNVSLSAFTAASGTNAGTYYDTVNNLSGTASGNYQLASNGNTPGSLVIAAKPLNYIGSTTNVTYNASPQSANNTYQLTGVIASDIGNVSLSAATPASGTNAGTYLDAVTNLRGTASGNYQLANSGNTLGSLVIGAKPLTYIGSTTNVIYNASPQSANNTYQLTGVIASDLSNVSLTASASASGTNAGTYLDTVTSLSGAASGNYQLAISGNTLGSLVIAAKPLNYIGSTTNVTYNATPQSANNTYQLTGVIASDLSNVSLTASASASGTNAGTYLDTVASLSGTASGNYQLASSGNTLGSLVIAAKPLTYIGSTTNVTYNANPQSANNTYQLAGVIASDIGNVSLSAAIPASGTNVGTYQDTVTSLSGTASENYQLASSGNTLGSLVIAAKSLTYIGSTTNVTYNANPQSANNAYTLKGVIASDIGNVSLSAATPASGTNAGTYLDTLNSLSGAAAGNYQLVSGGSTLGSLVIAAKTLTLSSLTANNKVYDTTTTATIASYGTLLGDARSSNDNRYYAGDTVELVKSNASANFSDPNVGTGKTVTVTGLALSNSNYTLADPTTTANITAQALNLLAITGSRRYNGTTLFTYQDFDLTGALKGEVVSLTAGSANTPSPNVGVYDNRPLSGLAISVANGRADNYTLPTTANLTITKAPLTISATSDSRAYNGTSVSNALPTYSKLFENDTLTGLSQSFASKDAKGTGASTLNVNIGFVLNDGNDGGNYEVTRVPAPGTITPAKLTVAGVTAASKVYDGTRFALLSGGGIEVLGRDSVTLVKTDAIGSFDSKDVGTAKPVIATGYALSGADAGNYSLIQPAGLLADITPKALRIVANNDTRTYDGMAYNGGNGVTYIGFVAGESQAMLSGILSYGGTSQGAVNVGIYTLQPKGLASRNYSLSMEAGRLSILAAPPVVPLIAQWAQAYVPLEPKPTAVPVPASAPSIVTQGRLTIISPPQANTVGVATLAVNQTLPAPGQSIQIPMPRELLGLSRVTVNVSGLPPWLNFDPLDQVFIVRAVPFGVETIQITVQVDGKIWNLTLDFRNN